jgi:hypothetical protein
MPDSPSRVIDSVLRGRDSSDERSAVTNGRSLSPAAFTESVKDRARRGARQQAGLARQEVGRRAFDLLEEYFPEEAKSRRQRNSASVFLLGLAVGILLRQLAER